jgi:hypothetical protein
LIRSYIPKQDGEHLVINKQGNRGQRSATLEQNN